MAAAALSFADRAEIEHACTGLCLDYSYFADSSQMDAWAALFAEDAEMVLMGQTHKGRAAIRASVNTDNRDKVATFHSLSNIRIGVLSDTEAHGTVGIVLYMAPKVNGMGSAASLAPAAIGAYHDVYRKTAEGWRFARREFIPSMMRAQS